jgi:hypothetical protein
VPLKVDVLRDRSTLSREADDGRIENVFRLHISNTDECAHRYAISVSGIDGIDIVGERLVEVPSASSTTVALSARVEPGAGKKGSNQIFFEVRAENDDADCGAREDELLPAMKSKLNAGAQPWYREPWPWLLMLGPVVVIVAGFVTAYLAVVSNDGLVEDDYYKQGLAVNQRTARDQRAAELGIEVELLLGGAVTGFAPCCGQGGLPPAGSAEPAHCASDAPGFRSEGGSAFRGGRGLYGGRWRRCRAAGMSRSRTTGRSGDWRVIG